MKIVNPAIISGIIILIMGTIFHFQGQGDIGPESSFMYSNPDWISYGMQITITGMIILGIGLGFRFVKR